MQEFLAKKGRFAKVREMLGQCGRFECQEHVAVPAMGIR
jgi:hypothetical protein